MLSVDLPFVNEGLLKYLLEEEAGSQVTLPRSGEEFVEPLCVCYHSSVLPILEDFISKKKFKLQEFVMNVNMNSLIINACLPFYEAHSFHNINTPSDLFIARKILKVT